jgi:carboxymethylenebutenolidase
MQGKIRARVNARQDEGGEISRRELLRSLAVLTGGCTAAHFFLESDAFAASLIPQKEAQSPDVEASVDTETVRYPCSSGKYQIEAYLAQPKGTGPHPAVILIHESRGLNDNIRDVARRFAAEGFVVLAPDLLSPAGGTGSVKNPQAVVVALRKLPVYGMVDDLKTSFEYLGKSQKVDAQKIAAVGFDYGVWRTFALASAVPDLYKAVIFYGSTPDDGLDQIKAPILAHYAERDGRFTGQAVWIRKKMGKQYQFFVYPDTDHDFFNATDPRYDPAAAKLAWVRTLAFLRNQPLPTSVTLDKDDVKKPAARVREGGPVD